jgi:hypothetical protein
MGWPLTQEFGGGEEMRTFAMILAFAMAGTFLLGQEPQSSAPAPTQPSSDLMGGRTWTSLTTSKDYRVRLDSDYIYTEWTNVPPEWGVSAFSRAELKKTGTIWKGHTRMQFPCQYKDIWSGGMKINSVTLDPEIEITSMTDTRIEGRAQNYGSGFDCKAGKSKGEPTWTSFTWIPKEHESESKQLLPAPVSPAPVERGGQPSQGPGVRTIQVYGQGMATATSQVEGDSIAYNQAVAQLGAKCLRGRVQNITRTSGQCFGNPGIGGFPPQYQCTVSVRAICE